jgi:hypothetical protein
MIASAVNTRVWKEVFTKKFLNFARKCPILLSFIITIQGGEEGVLITHTNSDTKYFFRLDYDQPVKDFIAEIKKILVAKHYPRLVDEMFVNHELSVDEMAKSLEDGKSIEGLQKFELRKVGERQYRVDKILSWRDTFVLVLENSSYAEDDDEIGKSFLYKMNTSSVLFLRKYRQNGFGGLREASKFFFDNSILVRAIEPTDQEVNLDKE